MSTGKLSATAVKNAKPRATPYKLADGGGLYLLVKPQGGKYWRHDIRTAGKRKTLAHGVYPAMSLQGARAARDKAREQLASGIDPTAAKRAAKIAQAGAESFEAVAREWYDKHRTDWSASQIDRINRIFDKMLFPWLGKRPISEVSAPELLQVLRRIESRGALHTAHRAHQTAGRVFRYAVATGRAERDPSGDLRGALPPAATKHHAAVTTPKEVGALLRAIDGYSGQHVTRCALKLAPLVFVRIGELRNAEWSEIDLDAREWRIPAEKMKMRQLHVVPLSKQALAVLTDLSALTGSGTYLFPSIRTPNRPMSENTINAALRRLGYGQDDMTGHGFRSIASTLLNEQGWHRDAIERQLAHAERNSVRAAYNYAEHLPVRREMMQAWANHLDSLRSGAEIVGIKRVTNG